jgi:hypothetical protein
MSGALPMGSDGRSLPMIKPGTNQRLAVGVAPVQSAAFGAASAYVRIYSSVDVYLAFGSNPTATTSDLVLSGGAAEFFAVAPGSKVSVLKVQDVGFATVTEGVA